MTYAETISAKAATYQKVAANILARAETEHRSLTNAEQNDVDGLIAKAEAAVASAERATRVSGFGTALSVPAGTPVSVGDDNRAAAPYRGFGEFLRAVRDASVPGGVADPRLQTRAAGMNEGLLSDGGYLVDQTFANQIFARVHGSGELAKRCRRIPVSAGSNGVRIPFIDESSRATGSRLGGVQVYRVPEADTAAATKPRFGRIELELTKLMAIGYATDELLQDSALLGRVILDGFAEELAFVLDDEIIRGTGAGQCLGILNSPALVTVAKEQSQAGSTLLYANVLKMWSRLWGRSRPRAVWRISQSVEPQLYSMSLTVGTGGSAVFLPGGGASSEPYSTLFGRPIIPVEQCAALGSVGDILAVDLSEYLMIDKGGVQQAQSMHVRFLYDEQCFRVVYRVSGCPLWKTPLTPFKGSDTVSPFVALGARS